MRFLCSPEFQGFLMFFVDGSSQLWDPHLCSVVSTFLSPFRILCTLTRRLEEQSPHHNPLHLCRPGPSPRASSVPLLPPLIMTAVFLSCCRSWTPGSPRLLKAPRSSAEVPLSASCRHPAVARDSLGCPRWTQPSPPEGRCHCHLSGNLRQAVSGRAHR